MRFSRGSLIGVAFVSLLLLVALTPAVDVAGSAVAPGDYADVLLALLQNADRITGAGPLPADGLACGVALLNRALDIAELGEGTEVRIRAILPDICAKYPEVCNPYYKTTIKPPDGCPMCGILAGILENQPDPAVSYFVDNLCTRYPWLCTKIDPIDICKVLPDLCKKQTGPTTKWPPDDCPMCWLLVNDILNLPDPELAGLEKGLSREIPMLHAQDTEQSRQLLFGVTEALAFTASLSASLETVPVAVKDAVLGPYWKFVQAAAIGVIARDPSEVMRQIGEVWNDFDWPPVLYGVVVTGRDLTGLAFDGSTQALYYVDSGSGLKGRDGTLGTFDVYSWDDTGPIVAGLRNPQDVVVDRAGQKAYIVEDNGRKWWYRLPASLVTIDLTAPYPITLDATRSGTGWSRTTLASGVQQIAVSSDGEKLYAVANDENLCFGPVTEDSTDLSLYSPCPPPYPSHLLCVDLADPVKPVSIVAELGESSYGLALDETRDCVYVTSEGTVGSIVQKVDLDTKLVTKVADLLVGPGSLAWESTGHTSLYVVEQDSQRNLRCLERVDLDLGSGTSTVTYLYDLSGEPSVRDVTLDVLSPRAVYISSPAAVLEVDLETVTSEPSTIGMVGDVPYDAIKEGHACTASNDRFKAYRPFDNAAFGGTLDLRLNPDFYQWLHSNADYYSIEVRRPGSADWVNLATVFDGTWSDRVYNRSLDWYYSLERKPFRAFLSLADDVLVYRIPDPSNPIVQQVYSGMIMRWPTSENGEWHLRLKAFKESPNWVTEVSLPAIYSNDLMLEIDNTPPEISILDVQHRTGPDKYESLHACAVVMGLNDFRISVRAFDPQGNLLSFGLEDLTGNNVRRDIGSKSYKPAMGLDWCGDTFTLPMDSDVGGRDHYEVAYCFTRCAHTFHLTASGRVCNGWDYIQWGEYYWSFTTAVDGGSSDPATDPKCPDWPKCCRD